MRKKKLLCSIFLVLSIVGGLSGLAGTQGQKREPEKAEKKPLPLKLVQTIPLPGVEGRIDHMNVDVQGKRLFMVRPAAAILRRGKCGRCLEHNKIGRHEFSSESDLV
jgi:hypothetical protein